MERTIEAQVVEQTADELEQEPFIEEAEATQNRQGPYVVVHVADRINEDKAYGIVDEYPVYIEVVCDA